MRVRRSSRANTQQGRSGCLGTFVGLAAGLVLAYFAYEQTGNSVFIILLAGAGALLGGQAGQRLAQRRRGGGPRRRRG